MPFTQAELDKLSEACRNDELVIPDEFPDAIALDEIMKVFPNYLKTKYNTTLSEAWKLFKEETCLTTC